MAKIHVIPECHADKVFVNALLEGHIDFSHHAGGIHEVARSLKLRDVPGYVNIGFVDKDKKNIPPYFDEFIIIEELVGKVIFKKHPKTRDYLIIIVPAIEKFLLRQMEQFSLTPNDFNLPNDLKSFCKKLKKSTIEANQDFKDLITYLVQNHTQEIEFIYRQVSNLVTLIV